jgi:hypothetical protein
MLEANEYFAGQSFFQNGMYNMNALFHLAPETATVIDHNSRPTWNAPGSWMRFEVLDENDPEMAIRITPTLTIAGEPVRVRHRRQLQLQANFAQGDVTWQASGDVTVNSDGVVTTSRALARGTVTATDGEGNTHAVEVRGYLNFGQWLIWIFLLGFLWY